MYCKPWKGFVSLNWVWKMFSRKTYPSCLVLDASLMIVVPWKNCVLALSMLECLVCFILGLFSILFIKLLLKSEDNFFFFLSNLYTRSGSWNHNPKIKTCMPYSLSQPGTPTRGPLFISTPLDLSPVLGTQ